MKLHHVSFAVAGTMLLVALIPPFDEWSITCLVAAAVNLTVGIWNARR
jgi:hypothetical protein